MKRFPVGLAAGLLQMGLLAACAASPSRASQKAPRTASEATASKAYKEKNVAQETLDLGLTDEDFWKEPFRTRAEIEGKLLDAGQEAFVIGAPRVVSLKDRESLPVVVERTATLDHMARLPFRPHAVLTAVDLKTNTVYAYMAIVKNVKEPKRYDGPPLEGMGGEAFVINARQQLNLPWTPGRLLLGLVMRDQVSNRVRVDLRKGGYADPAVAEYLEAREKDIEPPPVSPAAAISPLDMKGRDLAKQPPLPCYSRWSGSPGIPAAPGIALAVDRVVPITANTACVLRGSFRLPVQDRDKVKHAQAQTQEVFDRPTAVVGITLLLTGSDSAVPVLVAIKVPSYDPVEAETAEVTGFFTLDLANLGNLTGMEQTYFIYALSGETMAGPFPMALVRK
jgi:hypothetical protein